jgi:hypothetical protein
MAAPDRAERDLRMMRSPAKWPCWPRLPLKRFVAGATTLPDTGFMVAQQGIRTRVYHGIIFAPARPGDFKDYPSYEAIVADGWRVD